MGEHLAKALDQLRELTPEPGVEYEIIYQHIRWEPMNGGWGGRWCNGCDECVDGFQKMKLTRTEYSADPIKLKKTLDASPELAQFRDQNPDKK